MQHLLAEIDDERRPASSRGSAPPSRERIVLGALDAFPAHVAIVDSQGAIVAVNRQWREFAASNGGTEAACSTGANYLEACRRAATACSPGAAEVATALERLLAGEIADFETQYPCHAPDEPRWFVVRMRPFVVGEQACVLISHENVTYRKVSRETIDLLSLVATRTANGVIITDAEQRIEWVNDAFVAMTGYSRGEALGRRPGRLLQREDSNGPALESVRLAVTAGRSVTATLLNYRKDGTPFYVELRIDPVHDDRGQVRAFVAIQVDVTDRRRLEQEVARAAQHERERIAGDLHDGLGQQLTGARLLVGAAQAALPPEHGAGAALQKAMEALQRAAASARALARGMAPVHVTRGLHPSLVELASEMTVPGTVVVDFRGDADPVVLGGPAEQLYRIAQECIANAVRHGRASRIEIALRVAGRSVELRVADDGDGFVPDSAAPGLGLKLIRHRVDALHGELRIDSAPGRGTTITCVVPA